MEKWKNNVDWLVRNWTHLLFSECVVIFFFLKVRFHIGSMQTLSTPELDENANCYFTPRFRKADYGSLRIDDVSDSWKKNGIIPLFLGGGGVIFKRMVDFNIFVSVIFENHLMIMIIWPYNSSWNEKLSTKIY